MDIMNSNYNILYLITPNSQIAKQILINDHPLIPIKHYLSFLAFSYLSINTISNGNLNSSSCRHNHN